MIGLDDAFTLSSAVRFLAKGSPWTLVEPCGALRTHGSWNYVEFRPLGFKLIPIS